MKKEQLFIKTALSLFLLGSAGCAIEQFTDAPPDQGTLTPTPFMPITRTPFMPLYRETPTSTFTPTPTETFTPTPTPIPTEIFSRNGVEFDNEQKEIFFTIEKQDTEGENIFINFSYLPLFYPDDASQEEADAIVNQYDAPGNHRGLTDTDGNVIILQLHSGWVLKQNGWYEDEAEELRKFIEGNNNSTILDPDYINTQIQRLIGSQTTIRQDNAEVEFLLVAVGIIPHENKPSFDNDIKKTLDWAISVNPDFAIFQHKSGGILMSFCGWGPEGDPDRYVYKDYIIGFLPVAQ